jgi:hypothetical protein
LIHLTDYSKYNYFGHLCEVPKDVLNNLQEYYDRLQSVQPTMQTDVYKQWFVQKSYLTNWNIDVAFTEWTDDNFLKITKEFFSEYVDDMLRFRFSHLATNGPLDYHTKHQLPRIHVPLNDSGSLFVIKDDNGTEHSYKLEYGSAHFINVTFLHKVVATREVERKNSFFCFTKFKNEKIEERFLNTI